MKIKPWQERRTDFAAQGGRGTWLDEECMEEEITELRAALAQTEQERDAALAKLASLAAQEPVALLAQGISGGIVGAERLYFPQERNEAIEFCAAAHEKGGYPVTEISPLYAAAGAAPVPEGWQLVPVEPTTEMIKAGMDCPLVGPEGEYDAPEDYKAVFKAMLTAASKEPS